MGSIKSSESLVTNLEPTSPNGSSISEPGKKTNHQSSDPEQSSLTPPSLSFPGVKFELDGDMEMQLPDSSVWETFFSDHHGEADFMISSPVRSMPSPQASSCCYNYIQSMQGQSLSGSGSGWSPPGLLSQLGIGKFSSSSKGKGPSPLHKVFNSPNNQYLHNLESLHLPLVAMDDFLDGCHREQGSSAQLFDMSSTADPSMIDCLTMPHSSRFCGSVNEAPSAGSQLTTRDGDIYQMSCVGGTSTASLSQQLQRELQLEKQQPQQRATPSEETTPTSHPQNFNHTLMMVPLPSSTEQEEDSGLQLVHLLLACAESVAKEDYLLAKKYIHHLNRVASPLGNSMQRVATCFAEALSARLAATLSGTTANAKPFSPFPPNSMEILKIYQILYQACPYIKFAHFTANQAIFEAFEAESRVHVIDLDILQGYQWPAFMQALTARPGGAPFLRITGIGSSIESVRETGQCLTELANSLHVPFEFHPVVEELQDIRPHMFNRRVGEALAVNSVNRLHRVPGNSLGNVLAMIRDQAPKIVTLVEQEASHNGPYFLGRFLEALHYYSAIFDSLDATFPPDSAQRAKVEQYIFSPEIRNIVACEGAERTERHERLEKWRKIMGGKGFEGMPLSANAVGQSKILLGLYSCDGYRLTEDNGCLLVGWEDRAILAASAWRC